MQVIFALLSDHTFRINTCRILLSTVGFICLKLGLSELLDLHCRTLIDITAFTFVLQVLGLGLFLSYLTCVKGNIMF